MSEVVIRAPIAIPPVEALLPTDPMSDTERAALLAADNRRLRGELQRATITASSVSNIALALARMCSEHNGEAGQVRIPRRLSDRMEGCELTIGEIENGDILVRIREGTVGVPVQIEGT